MTWRLANSIAALRRDVNARWPSRDKTSDGTIGDAAHASRDSDHNPWIVVDGVGVVRAFDCDVDGIDAAWYAEQLRLLGLAGDHRLTGGGYVIYNRRITASDFSGWKTYTGTNPHTGHVHVSVSQNQAGFDDGSSWAFLAIRQEVDQLSWSEELDLEAPGSRMRPPDKPRYSERHRASEALGDTMYYAADAMRTVQRVEVKLDALTDKISDDEANIIAAVRAIDVGNVDEDRIAQMLGPILVPFLQAGATPEQMEQAVRKVIGETRLTTPNTQ